MRVRPREIVLWTHVRSLYFDRSSRESVQKNFYDSFVKSITADYQLFAPDNCKKTDKTTMEINLLTLFVR